MCGPSEHKRKGAELGINGFVSTCFVSDFYMDSEPFLLPGENNREIFLGLQLIARMKIIFHMLSPSGGTENAFETLCVPLLGNVCMALPAEQLTMF